MLLSNIQFTYLKNGTWNTFSNAVESTIDGIQIQTPSNNSFYLKYRTWNEGKSTWYSKVDSNTSDYAGAPNRPVQRLQIQVYKNDGTKLTEKIVVMYRARVSGRWLPWVSNAEPEWMQSVHSKYNLGGTIDTESYFAGNAGQNIDGLEIRVYEEDMLGDFTGGEISATMQYMVGSLDNWQSFDNGVYAEQIDGIKIQTGTEKGYYLQYRSKNEGKSDWYSYVKSTGTAYNDYAGLPGKPIQLLEINAYKNDGTKLSSGVIVMYRVSVAGRWLPWVSNTDAQWMQNMQNKYSLGGTLSPNSTYAGNAGQNIDGVEIHVYEDASENAGLGNFSGIEEIISCAYMANNGEWNAFEKSATASEIDGITIGTDLDDSYYFMYKSWNEGNNAFYPEVSSLNSLENNYTGHAGKPIQLLSIQAYNQDGTRLRSGVVVMYRVRIAGRWLPWVSNADPEWMRSVQKQFGLDGTLDTKSTYAGNKGQNIDGVEIRVFRGETDYHPVGSLPGSESNATFEYMTDSLSNWNVFSNIVTNDHIDGIKIRTDSSKPYYISYRSWNSGKSNYYPYVDSRGTAYNDYAGYPGKPIQLLNIYVYRKNDGVKIKSGVVVMYRVRIAGRWLPWVSNADPEWMRSVQEKYDLGGTLDTKSTYAGNKGQNIDGVEIHIYEESNTDGGTITPVGNYKIIQNVPFISQLPKYPTGCESVSTVMALNYAGVNITVDDFIDNYLNKRIEGVPFNPHVEFGGNPRSSRGYGCYMNVIKVALDKLLADNTHYAKGLLMKSLESLCADYIDKDIPVILWATQNMVPPRNGKSWILPLTNQKIQWISPMHCLLLIGYDEKHYIFNDPMEHELTYYPKSAVETAYKGLSQQALVVLNDTPTSVYPIHKYGSVENPVTKEIYPIMVYKNNERYVDSFEKETNTEEKKPTYLSKTNWDIVKFIAGLEFSNSYSSLKEHAIGGKISIFLGCATSLVDSLESVYFKIDYYKSPKGILRQAVIHCGETKLKKLFSQVNYAKPVSLKSVHSYLSGSDACTSAIWNEKVNSSIKDLYANFKEISPNDSYKYDLEYTFNPNRENDEYFSQIFLDKDGDVYEYATIYPDEKIEIVVVKGKTEIDRLNILPLINPISKLSDEQRNVLNILLQS